MIKVLTSQEKKTTKKGVAPNFPLFTKPTQEHGNKRKMRIKNNKNVPCS
jgi:hypothetical protein